MKSSNTKNIVVAKLKLPTEVYAMILFMTFTIGVILKQMFFNIEAESNWTLLLLGCFVGLLAVIFIARNRYRQVTVYNDRLLIKPLFSQKGFIIRNENLKGFEIFETVIIGGLGYNIKITTLKDKKLIFPRDCYKNYEEFVSGLHKSELKYLGKKEWKSNYKESYRNLLKWSAILIPILFGLLTLLKLTK